jgi:hypothetical protein
VDDREARRVAKLLEGAVVELDAVHPREDRDASRLFKPLRFGHDGLDWIV